MDDDEPLMGIGAFARRVGLAPSALRFYDDCAVLRPTRVDAATGYRYYAPEQAPRADLLRRLREAELPLAEATTVLDGPPEEARAVLRDHLRRTRESAAAARAAIEDVLRALPGGARRTRARVGGAELAGAVRQVGSAVATGAVREEFPVLGRVLIELAEQELRLVATDRYRLSVRALRPLAIEGEPCGLIVGIEELRDLAGWARGLPEVAVEVDGAEVRVQGGGEERALSAAEEVFPAYGLALDGLAAARHRVIADRAALCAAVAERVGDGPVVLRTGDGVLTVEGGRPLPAVPHGVRPGAARGTAAGCAPGAPARDTAVRDAAAGGIPLAAAVLGNTLPVARGTAVGSNPPPYAGGTTAGDAPLSADDDPLPSTAHGATPPVTAGDPLADAADGDPLPARADDTPPPSVSDGNPLSALCTGSPLRIAFDPAVLVPALEASVGPDVLLEIASEREPVVVRSADQGSFTTLVMPVRTP
ncbi:MerR family transcriptional regulator [Streptomyces sp. NPDC021212]|uniref:MerR family transcriptional regulator n=1 Tax=Streptomyces sp. NPDC021212 TaxID=3365118 RepID=UPI003795A9EF